MLRKQKMPVGWCSCPSTSNTLPQRFYSLESSRAVSLHPILCRPSWARFGEHHSLTSIRASAAKHGSIHRRMGGQRVGVVPTAANGPIRPSAPVSGLLCLFLIVDLGRDVFLRFIACRFGI
jgi:hypothetical protein